VTITYFITVQPCRSYSCTDNSIVEFQSEIITSFLTQNNFEILTVSVKHSPVEFCRCAKSVSLATSPVCSNDITGNKTNNRRANKSTKALMKPFSIHTSQKCSYIFITNYSSRDSCQTEAHLKGTMPFSILLEDQDRIKCISMKRFSTAGKNAMFSHCCLDDNKTCCNCSLYA